jgi:hypothetical protein
VIHQFPQPAPEATALPTLLIEAARCWRDARDTGELSLPSLSAMLATHDRAMLAPVLDSLCLFYEAALGRPMSVGGTLALSDDEHLLLALVDGSEPDACLDCSDGTASTLDCALCATRLMLACNYAQRTPPTMQ